jgi:hypothetical protein
VSVLRINYGARGIRFLFTSFEEFFAELGPRPEGKDANGKALCSLDRKNNDGHYQPGNVRWATASEQRSNQRPMGEEQKLRISETMKSHS